VFEDGFLIYSNILNTFKDETKKNEENKSNIKIDSKEINNKNCVSNKDLYFTNNLGN